MTTIRDRLSQGSPEGLWPFLASPFRLRSGDTAGCATAVIESTRHTIAPLARRLQRDVGDHAFELLDPRLHLIRGEILEFDAAALQHPPGTPAAPCACRRRTVLESVFARFVSSLPSWRGRR